MIDQRAPNSPAVSVVIVTTRPRDDFDPLTAFVADPFEDYEVIIRRDEGIATARNRGIREASAEKIVFIDDDAAPEPGYLATVNRLLADYPVLVGRTLQPPTAFSAGWELPWYDRGSGPRETRYLAGCNMAFRREIFDCVGYFDERFEWGCEEGELAERIRNAGVQIRYSPEMVVEHVYAESMQKLLYKKHVTGRSEIKWWDKQSGTDPRYKALRYAFPSMRGHSGLSYPARFCGQLAQRLGWAQELIA